MSAKFSKLFFPRWLPQKKGGTWEMEKLNNIISFLWCKNHRDCLHFPSRTRSKKRGWEVKFYEVLIISKAFIYAPATELFHLALQIIKHEYLRSRASTCVSLSSPSYLLAIYLLSRYSCLYLGSLHPRIFKLKVWSGRPNKAMPNNFLPTSEVRWGCLANH